MKKVTRRNSSEPFVIVSSHHLIHFDMDCYHTVTTQRSLCHSAVGLRYFLRWRAGGDQRFYLHRRTFVSSIEVQVSFGGVVSKIWAIVCHHPITTRNICPVPLTPGRVMSVSAVFERQTWVCTSKSCMDVFTVLGMVEGQPVTDIDCYCRSTRHCTRVRSQTRWTRRHGKNDDQLPRKSPHTNAEDAHHPPYCLQSYFWWVWRRNRGITTISTNTVTIHWKLCMVVYEIELNNFNKFYQTGWFT